MSDTRSIAADPSDQVFHGIDSLYENTRRHLLSLRGDHGHWDGELASSALSTATAVIALELYCQSDAPLDELQREQMCGLVTAGRRWLARTQNADGGWGDTVLSKSNISTTALVWAAFAGVDEQFAASMERCQTWLTRAAGGLEPRKLADAIARRYGKDRTFSVPILTTLAIRQRLGPSRDAWRWVPQLPFELAAFPHRWYSHLKLPVVSYALPALIAIGQVRHRFRPSRNPVLRVIRNAARRRTLDVLKSIQPTSGGFLEATPLTSFVALSLIAAGETELSVVVKGIDFLIASVRNDGSWPIDTNLATWVTTLAVNALCTAEGIEVALGNESALRVEQWLMNQQYRIVHPYTNSPPGAWAWTDLSGGVPDADDTPGALLALAHFAGPNPTTAQVAAATEGIRWLLNLQNADGGMPTFCRGWGVLPFDRSSADLTAHALRAFLRWQSLLPAEVQSKVDRSSQRGLKFLERGQRKDGAWAPLWFGNQHSREEENLAYGTSRVLLALISVLDPSSPTVALVSRPRIEAMLSSGVRWLLKQQNDDGGWGGEFGCPSSIEETALTVEALAGTGILMSRSSPQSSAITPERALISAVQRGLTWLSRATNSGHEFPPSPIGFYFAKLWYYEACYPVVYTLAAVGRALAHQRIIKQRRATELDPR